MNDVFSLARNARSFFVNKDAKGRDAEGLDSLFVTKPESPEWVKDMCRYAHSLPSLLPGFNGYMLPDDFRYKTIVDVLEIIDEIEYDFESENEVIACEVFSKVVERLDSNNNCYNHELIAWIGRNHQIRSEYINQVASEIGEKEFDFYSVLARAQFQEMIDVAELVVSYIFEKMMQKV